MNEFVHPLSMLQKLNNADKHKVLTRLVAQPNGMQMPWTPRRGEPLPEFEHWSRHDYSRRTGVIAVGEEYVRLRVPTWTEPFYLGVGQVDPDFMIVDDDHRLDYEVRRAVVFAECVVTAIHDEL